MCVIDQNFAKNNSYSFRRSLGCDRNLALSLGLMLMFPGDGFFQDSKNHFVHFIFLGNVLRLVALYVFLPSFLTISSCFLRVPEKLPHDHQALCVAYSCCQEFLLNCRLQVLEIMRHCSVASGACK